MNKILLWSLCILLLSVWIWAAIVAPGQVASKNPTGSEMFRALFMLGCGLLQLDLIFIFFFMRSLYRSYKSGEDRTLVLTIISTVLLMAAIVAVMAMVSLGSWLYVKLTITPLVCGYFLWRCLREGKMRKTA